MRCAVCGCGSSGFVSQECQGEFGDRQPVFLSLFLVCPVPISTAIVIVIVGTSTIIGSGSHQPRIQQLEGQALHRHRNIHVLVPQQTQQHLQFGRTTGLLISSSLRPNYFCQFQIYSHSREGLKWSLIRVFQKSKLKDYFYFYRVLGLNHVRSMSVNKMNR